MASAISTAFLLMERTNVSPSSALRSHHLISLSRQYVSVTLRVGSGNDSMKRSFLVLALSVLEPTR